MFFQHQIICIAFLSFLSPASIPIGPMFCMSNYMTSLLTGPLNPNITKRVSFWYQIVKTFTIYFSMLKSIFSFITRRLHTSRGSFTHITHTLTVIGQNKIGKELVHMVNPDQCVLCWTVNFTLRKIHTHMTPVRPAVYFNASHLLNWRTSGLPGAVYYL